MRRASGESFYTGEEADIAFVAFPRRLLALPRNLDSHASGGYLQVCIAEHVKHCLALFTRHEYASWCSISRYMCTSKIEVSSTVCSTPEYLSQTTQARGKSLPVKPNLSGQGGPNFFRLAHCTWWPSVLAICARATVNCCADNIGLLYCTASSSVRRELAQAASPSTHCAALLADILAGLVDNCLSNFLSRECCLRIRQRREMLIIHKQPA